MWNEISPPPETKKRGYYTVQLPVCVRKLDTYTVDRVSEYVAYGMAGAFHLLISNWSELGPVPELFNEQLAKISKCLKVNSPLPSNAKFIEELYIASRY